MYEQSTANRMLHMAPRDLARLTNVSPRLAAFEKRRAREVPGVIGTFVRCTARCQPNSVFAMDRDEGSCADMIQMQDMGDRIAARRRSIGWTQGQLAQRLGGNAASRFKVGTGACLPGSAVFGRACRGASFFFGRAFDRADTRLSGRRKPLGIRSGFSFISGLLCNPETQKTTREGGFFFGALPKQAFCGSVQIGKIQI